MAEASDPGQAIERHERTSEPDPSRLQPGWRVRDRTGSELGRVVERDDDSFVVDRSAVEGLTRIPMRLVADEDPNEQLVTLAVAARDLPA